MVVEVASENPVQNEAEAEVEKAVEVEAEEGEEVLGGVTNARKAAQSEEVAVGAIAKEVEIEKIAKALMAQVVAAVVVVIISLIVVVTSLIVVEMLLQDETRVVSLTTQEKTPGVKAFRKEMSLSTVEITAKITATAKITVKIMVKIMVKITVKITVKIRARTMAKTTAAKITVKILIVTIARDLVTFIALGGKGTLIIVATAITPAAGIIAAHLEHEMITPKQEKQEMITLKQETSTLPAVTATTVATKTILAEIAVAAEAEEGKTMPLEETRQDL